MKSFVRGAVLLLLVAMVRLPAQVITPVEVSDPRAQRLQQRYLQTLMAIGTELEAHKFPYPFYFSGVLDVDLAKMQLADQRSIRFDTYKGETVLEIGIIPLTNRNKKRKLEPVVVEVRNVQSC